jgi:hypothetical protein
MHYSLMEKMRLSFIDCDLLYRGTNKVCLTAYAVSFSLSTYLLLQNVKQKTLDRNSNELIFQIHYITRDSCNLFLIILTMQTD